METRDEGTSEDEEENVKYENDEKVTRIKIDVVNLKTTTPNVKLRHFRQTKCQRSAWWWVRDGPRTATSVAIRPPNRSPKYQTKAGESDLYSAKPV
jgi:hypothetical protein